MQNLLLKVEPSENYIIFLQLFPVRGGWDRLTQFPPLFKAYMHKGGGVGGLGGGFRPPKPKMYRVGGEKREKGKKREKSGKKAKIRLKIEKGKNRRKSSNLAKNMYKRLKIVS